MKRPSENSIQADGFAWGKAWPPPSGAGNFAGEEAPLPAGTGTLRQVISGYRDNYPQTAPVGSFPSDAFGLFDLSGNVWEWCQDWFDASQQKRVLRGAAWTDSDRPSLRVANRNRIVPDSRLDDRGFRVVLAPAP